MNLHIEMLGIPGSGKTTLYRHAFDLAPDFSLAGATDSEPERLARSRQNKTLRAIGRMLPVRTRSWLWRRVAMRTPERNSAQARFSSQHPELVEVIRRAQARNTTLARSNPRMHEWMMDLFATYQRATEDFDASTSLLLDEGFCNRAISLFGYEFGERDVVDLTAYMESIPQPDLVLWVDAPLERCAARLDQRGWPRRFLDLSAGERSRFLHSARECTLAAVNLLPTESVTRIENHGPLEAALSGVDAAVRTALERA